MLVWPLNKVGWLFLFISTTILGDLLGCIRYLEKHGKHILISCGCMLLFINMSLSCKHFSDGVSTWVKFEDHIYLLYKKNLPFIMYYGRALFLFTCKVNT